jgi:PAS domain-containing protein
MYPCPELACFESVILSEAKDPFAVPVSRAASSFSANNRFFFRSPDGTPHPASAKGGVFFCSFCDNYHCLGRGFLATLHLNGMRSGGTSFWKCGVSKMNGNSKPQYSHLFNAIPVPLFIVDDDVRILDSNAAAQRIFGLSNVEIRSRRGGEVLHCLNSRNPEGCGKAPACKDCVIRNSVADALKAVAVTQRPMKFQAVSGEKTAELELLITSTPFPEAGKNAVLVIVEDITEFSKLKAIIPICMHCKRIRNEASYWDEVDRYFHDHIGVDFSHGVCPECLQKIYGDILHPPKV